MEQIIYAKEVASSQDAIDAGNIVGAPNLNFAMLRGWMGSYIAVKLWDEPVPISSITVDWINDQYAYRVTPIWSFQLSSDGVTWPITFAKGDPRGSCGGDIGAGEYRKSVFNTGGYSFNYVRIIQPGPYANADFDFDAVEAFAILPDVPVIPPPSGGGMLASPLVLATVGAVAGGMWGKRAKKGLIGLIVGGVAGYFIGKKLGK